MVFAAGRSLNHYFATWLPVLSVLAAGVLRDLLRSLEDSARSPWTKRLAIGGILAAICLVPARDLVGHAVQLRALGPRNATPIAQEIMNVAGPSDSLLMWGAEAGFNFLLAVPAPTRYAYQYPLYTCGYTTAERIEELAAGIEREGPLIVDTANSNGLVPPLDAAAFDAWQADAEGCSLTGAMASLVDEIGRTYEVAGSLPSTGWTVYKPRSGAGQP